MFRFDFSTLDGTAKDAKVAELLTLEASEPFDLIKGPMLCKSSLAEEEHLLIFQFTTLSAMAGLQECCSMRLALFIRQFVRGAVPASLNPHRLANTRLRWH